MNTIGSLLYGSWWERNDTEVVIREAGKCTSEWNTLNIHGEELLVVLLHVTSELPLSDDTYLDVIELHL